jgi:putative transposase
MKIYSSIFPIEKMCKVFNLHRTSYYSWLKRKPSSRDLYNRDLSEEIRGIYRESKNTYGSPRITIALHNSGIIISRRRVARLMREMKLRSIFRKKFVVSTDSKHNYPVAENKLNRDFTVDGQGIVWVSDITYIRTSQGWLYLTVILDLADRKVVGWSLSSFLKASDTTVAAWKMAVKNRPVTQELIFHSDRGVQYACNEFKNLLSGYKLVERSMSRKGDCCDNAVAESFFKTIKVECVYQNKYKTKDQAVLSIFEYIETWYNTRRIHTTLKMSIKDYREKNQKLLVA